MGQMMEWKSVKGDGVPKTGDDFIVYDKYNERVTVGYVSGFFEGLETYLNKDNCNVTHYMELPLSPVMI